MGYRAQGGTVRKLIRTGKRKLLKYNNAFNSFRIIIINLLLKDDSIERIIIKKE